VSPLGGLTEIKSEKRQNLAPKGWKQRKKDRRERDVRRLRADKA
jgi:hypothetical protein